VRRRGWKGRGRCDLAFRERDERIWERDERIWERDERIWEGERG